MILSNLLASIVVTLVTNVTSTDNAKYEEIPNPCPWVGTGFACAVFHGTTQGKKIAEATERHDLHSVSLVTEAVCMFIGKEHRTVLNTSPVTNWTKHFRKSEAWVPFEPLPVWVNFNSTNYLRTLTNSSLFRQR